MSDYDKGWNAAIQTAIEQFEKAKRNAKTIMDLVQLDGVLAVLDTLKINEDDTHIQR